MFGDFDFLQATAQVCLANDVFLGDPKFRNDVFHVSIYQGDHHFCLDCVHHFGELIGCTTESSLSACLHWHARLGRTGKTDLKTWWKLLHLQSLTAKAPKKDTLKRKGFGFPSIIFQRRFVEIQGFIYIFSCHWRWYCLVSLLEMYGPFYRLAAPFNGFQMFLQWNAGYARLNRASVIVHGSVYPQTCVA